MARVFLIAQPSLDRRGRQLNLSGLSKFGEVIVLVTDGDGPNRKPHETLSDMARKLAQHEANFNEDYIVWAGGDTLAAVFMGVLMERSQAVTLRWLRYHKKRDPHTGEWDHQNGFYKPSTITLYEETDTTDAKTQIPA